MFTTPLGRLRILGLLEGVSFLLLLFIAMPLKYLLGLPQMVRITGMAHGLLFVAFVFAVIDVAVRFRWPLMRVVGALAASVVPFGPFILDGHLRREAEAEVQAG